MTCRSDRFNVGPGGELRVSHDGRRIGIYQDHLVSLFFEGLAGLNARVIELAPLADDDWTGTDEQDFIEIGIPRHLRKVAHASCLWGERASRVLDIV